MTRGGEKSGRTRWIVASSVSVILLGLAGGHTWVVSAIYADLPEAPLPPQRVPVGLASVSAVQCALCHAEIHDEWRRTDHAEAFTSPLYQVDLRDQGSPYVCAYCHTPLVAQRAEVVEGIRFFWPSLVADSTPNPGYDPALEAEGVTCAACHLRDGAMVGGHDIEGEAPHAVRYDPGFDSVEMCRPCHTLDITFGTELARPIQDTFAEWEVYRARGGEETCIDCHMPDVGARSLALDRPPRPSRSHALRGPGDVDFLRTGLLIKESALRREGAQVRGSLTIENGSGHRIPTAEPQRRVEVVLEVFGAGGEVLARSASVIQRVVQLPAMVEAVGQDTTLLPRETRRFDLEVSWPEGGVGARLAVRFILWEASDKVAMEVGLSPASLVRLVFERTL